MTEYDIVLRFKLLAENPVSSEAAGDLTRRLNDYNDGRYHFDVEMLHRGLVETFAYVAGGCYVTEDGGVALAVEVSDELPEELEGKWCVLCRDDRQPDGRPGPYQINSGLFASSEAARAWADGISISRFPVIVEAEKAVVVKAVLNSKGRR